jgi:hypothetical protein
MKCFAHCRHICCFMSGKCCGCCYKEEEAMSNDNDISPWHEFVCVDCGANVCSIEIPKVQRIRCASCDWIHNANITEEEKKKLRKLLDVEIDDGNRTRQV